eukprot:468816-Pelagomonas_calceolata.AAC.4
MRCGNVYQQCARRRAAFIFPTNASLLSLQTSSIQAPILSPIWLTRPFLSQTLMLAFHAKECLIKKAQILDTEQHLLCLNLGTFICTCWTLSLPGAAQPNFLPGDFLPANLLELTSEQHPPVATGIQKFTGTSSGSPQSTNHHSSLQTHHTAPSTTVATARERMSRQEGSNDGWVGAREAGKAPLALKDARRDKPSVWDMLQPRA